MTATSILAAVRGQLDTAISPATAADRPSRRAGTLSIINLRNLPFSATHEQYRYTLQYAVHSNRGRDIAPMLDTAIAAIKQLDSLIPGTINAGFDYDTENEREIAFVSFDVYDLQPW